jgi:hypothetical protein
MQLELSYKRKTSRYIGGGLFRLALSVVLVAGLASQVMATEITGSLGTPGGAQTTANFQNSTATNATDTRLYTNAADATIADGSTVAENALIYIQDGNGGANVTTIGTLNITDGKTLTVVLGGDDNTAHNVANDAASVDIGVTTGGGNLIINGGTAGVDLTVTQVIDFTGADSVLGDLTITNTAGASGFDTAAMTITNLSTTSMTADNITVTGSTGSVVATDAAGATTITNVTGTVAVSGVYSIAGGTGGTTATAAAADVGGNMILSEHAGAISGGTYTLSGGAGGTGSTTATSGSALAGSQIGFNFAAATQPFSLAV